MNGQRLGGAAAIALGIGFNIPYAVLSSLYDYPQILRRPAHEALQRFADGGSPVIFAWYGFMIAALALVPVAVALCITPTRLTQTPALALGAAIAGSLAGMSQAVGLARWVFVIPELARHAGSDTAQDAFDLLNAFGGVAIGENLGQLLTALFVTQLALLQYSEGARRLGLAGIVTAIAIVIGTGEGISIALGLDGQAFSFATIIGFLALSIWLVATGVMMLEPNRMQPAPPPSAHA